MKKLLQIFKKSTRTAKFGLVIVFLWIFCAVFAPFLAPYGPDEGDITQRLKEPAFVTVLKGGELDPDAPLHILGTDEMGRDVLTRIIYGSRISLIVGIMAVCISLAIGTALGLIAGYWGGWVDSVIMRIVDVMLAFPFMFMALCFMAVLGPSLSNVVLVLGITGWVPYTRNVRAQVLSLRTREFVVAAEVAGASKLRVLLRHILPNVLDSAIVLGTLEMASAILSESSLTFLGMGIPPTIPSWGQMVSIGRDYIYNAWWLSTFGGLAIFIVCLSINFVGDWIRDVRDPRLRGVR